MKNVKETKKSKNAENQQSVNQTENDLRNRPEPSRFAVQFDVAYGGVYVKKDGVSQTVPDMNLTVRQLLKNHTRGLSNDRHIKDPLYFDIQIPKIQDITDVDEYRSYLKTMLRSTEEFLAAEKKKKEEEEQKEEAKNKQLRIDEEAENQ